MKKRCQDAFYVADRTQVAILRWGHESEKYPLDFIFGSPQRSCLMLSHNLKELQSLTTANCTAPPLAPLRHEVLFGAEGAAPAPAPFYSGGADYLLHWIRNGHVLH